MQTQTVTSNDASVVSSKPCPIPQYVMEMPAPISDERVAFLISKGIDKDIAETDLEMVKIKLGEPKEGIGWTTEQCEDAEIEYKRYLVLCRKFPHPDYAIVPNKVMDTTWHYHILDTRAYCFDCDKLFAGYFHHFPYFGLRGDEDEKQLKASFEDTKVLYEKTFGESMVRGSVDGSDCWHDCQDRCHNACNNSSTIR